MQISNNFRDPSHNNKCPNSISSISLVNGDSHIKFVNHFGNLVPLYQFHKLFLHISVSKASLLAGYRLCSQPCKDQ